MIVQDLRQFIDLLEKNRQLIVINEPISPILEITEITDRVSKTYPENNKALLFRNIVGYEVPVLINAFGSSLRMALALGVDILKD